MQVFIVGTALETAMALDKKRKHKQWIEIQQILDALNGKIAWSNHPCTLQYKGYETWLMYYRTVIEYLNMDMMEQAKAISDLADSIRPPFHTQEYLNQMKKRLYTKNPEHYKQWEHLGKSEVNYYWSEVENKFIKYKNGKRIE